jgi:hypothetical protein
VGELRQCSSKRSVRRSERVIGRSYAEDVRFLSSCMIQSSGETASGTLIGETQLLLSGHSEIDLGDPTLKVHCRCGDTQEQGVAEVGVRSAVRHKDYIHSQREWKPSKTEKIDLATDEISERSFSDVQLVNLKKNPVSECKKGNPSLAPAILAPSMEKSRELIERAECYFAGSGTNDAGKTDAFRVTHVPQNYVLTRTPDQKREVLFYLNEQSLRGFDYLLSERLSELKKAKVPKTSLLSEKAAGEAQIDKWKKLVESDAKWGRNKYLQGDSGGSLFCKDAATGNSFLVGVLINGQQDVILVAQPAISSWLQTLRP